ncbi:hypothetical protein BGS_1236 [Beggiatoa sp. SS]|nr:hypothetical protein BGS_1236 [Beggiatoa sp. SS]
MIMPIDLPSTTDQGSKRIGVLAALSQSVQSPDPLY